MNKTKTIVIIAVFAALICVLTMFPKIPVPLPNAGYIHLGDALIILAAIYLGIYSLPAAAVGSALADLLSGYAIYAPATFFIKAFMALCVYLIFKAGKNGVFCILGAITAELVMSAGYFIYEFFLYGSAAATAALPFNFIQAAGGIILGTVFYYLTRTGRLKTLFDNIGGINK